MKRELILTILIIIVSIIIGFLAGKSCSYNAKTASYKEIIRDTVIKEIKLPPVKIIKAKPVIKIIRDTVIEAKPFIASLDTVAKDDTVKMQYEYPENNFSLEVARKPDSLKVEKLTIIDNSAVKDYWWEKPAYFTGGAVLGLIIGIFITK